MNKPVLIVSLLYKSRGGVGGMAQRFSYLGSYLASRGNLFETLTTRSLISSLNLKVNSNVKVVEDEVGLYSTKNILTLGLIFLRVALGRYSHVHISGAGKLSKPFVFLCKISRTKVSCTFASRTLKMASYGNIETEARWIDTLNAVDAIDVLNPSHDLGDWKRKISVSPCSFPSKRNLIPNEYSSYRDELAVFCGALEKTKNPILALSIIDAYLDEYGGNLSIIVFGRGSLYSEVSEKANQLNMKYGRRVVSFGDQGKLIQVLSKASIFLSLQEFDNYPSQSLMEAMLLGCKVIATDEGDTSLMLPKDESGNTLVGSRKPDDYVDAVHAALSSRSASKANSNFIDESQSVERFSEYFYEFVGLVKS